MGAPPEPTGRDWAEVVPIGDVPVRGAALWPDREAIVFPQERLTYAQVAAGAERTARSLRSLGVGPGDHVGVLMANCPEFVHVLYGTTMLGAVAVLINARYQGDDLAHVIADADLTLLVTGDQPGQPFEMVRRVEAALPGLDPFDPDGFPSAAAPLLRTVVVLGGEEPAAAYTGAAAFRAAAGSVEPAEVHALRRRASVRDVGIMMYTSGTTSRPKGCLISHEVVVRNGIAVGDRLDVRDGDRFWDPLPMFHMSAVLPMTACLCAGATFVSMSHFDADDALDLMASERVTHAYPTFPTITQAIANHPRFADTAFDDLRVVNNVAPPARLRELQELWPKAALVTAYGSTEVGGCVSFSSVHDALPLRTDTCGPPFPGIEVRITDAETGAALPVGGRGEICVRGYSLFEGYHGAPEQTAEKLDADGWFHTGDIGRLDEDGRISYLGRLKDMLKVGGENVAAAEIEELLQSHPAVSIAQVVGVPDDRLVEVPAAFVEARPGAELDPAELLEWVRGRLANFKLPHHVRVVTEWPVAATKIQKFRLRQQLCAELGLPDE
jgi:acyl-CoA synthetase (AMP-forming)/AMP-acid ligase II